MLTPLQIARACGAKPEDALRFTEGLNEAMTRFEINTPKRQAAFLATVAVESGYLTTTRENLNYTSADRLVKLFPRAFKTVEEAQPFVRNPVALGKKLYGNYPGKGLICLTWEANYSAAGASLGYDYVRNPEMVEQPRHAALTAGWFWWDRGCNALADADNMDEITRRVNGPKKLHLAERIAMACRAAEFLA